MELTMSNLSLLHMIGELIFIASLCGPGCQSASMNKTQKLQPTINQSNGQSLTSVS